MSGAGMKTRENTPWEPDPDPVNQPSHYMLFPDLEVIDLIRQTLTIEEFKGYCKGNILKYRLRAGNKGDAAEDIAKAKVYEGWLRDCDISHKVQASDPEACKTWRTASGIYLNILPTKECNRPECGCHAFFK